MIPVTLQPEPADFDEKVRQKGLKWLAENNIDPEEKLPEGTTLKPFWQNSNPQLWEAYQGICAYLAIFFEWSTGVSSTDHYLAKSKHPRDAYEWKNYRLSCLGPNRNKNRFDDVLDPVGLAQHTFRIDFSCGKIVPSPDLSPQEARDAKNTIRRLKLDSPRNNEMRARHFQEYIENQVELSYLERHSPFVYSEIRRQGLE